MANNPRGQFDPDRLEQENTDLRRKLRETERIAQFAVTALRQARLGYGVETSLAWATLIAMVLANALAFSWAR